MTVVLISTYDLGRQPFGLASPAAWLSDAGFDVVCADLAKDRLPRDAVARASLVAFFLPMHTATRLALPVIDRVRRLNPSVRLAAYGLYAPLNESLLRERGVQDVLGGEFEQALLDAAVDAQQHPEAPGSAGQHPAAPRSTPQHPDRLPRLDFRTPSRTGLPSLERYASLQIAGERRTVGYTEASRGCKHRCRHCPIVPVYDGRFRIVPPDVVLADIAAQVAAGARHVTFGDPDFFNGIKHARTIVERLASDHPGVTYDVTIKIEHLLQHADALPLLRTTGCAFITSAVESVDDVVLRRLEKGHTRADFEQAVALCRENDVALSPTFVAFTPWTSLQGYLDLLHAIDRLSLVQHVAPIQYAIRLLVPQGSRILELDDVRRLVRPFDPLSLTHPWDHPDARVDALQRALARLVGVRVNATREDVFARVWQEAHSAAGIAAPERTQPVIPTATIPYLNEPWYC